MDLSPAVLRLVAEYRADADVLRRNGFADEAVVLDAFAYLVETLPGGAVAEAAGARSVLVSRLLAVALN
jgi:hypothetical protein